MCLKRERSDHVAQGKTTNKGANNWTFQLSVEALENTSNSSNSSQIPIHVTIGFTSLALRLPEHVCNYCCPLASSNRRKAGFYNWENYLTFFNGATPESKKCNDRLRNPGKCVSGKNMLWRKVSELEKFP